jgi:IclR family acetate operon transcriptional repressor
VYRAKVDPTVGAMKLTSVIGGRNPAHCTGVGKMLLALALADDRAVRSWIASGPSLERRTDRTKIDADDLAQELATIRGQGYATEEHENEVGIGCLAVPIFMTSSSVASGAISVAALTYRTPLASLVTALPEIRSIVESLSLRAAS